MRRREGKFYVVGNFGSCHSYNEYVVGKSCYNQNVVISVMVRFFSGFGYGRAGSWDEGSRIYPTYLLRMDYSRWNHAGKFDGCRCFWNSINVAVGSRPDSSAHLCRSFQPVGNFNDKGVNVVFAAAGGVGVGVINEAVARTKAGHPVWVIGVDVDQYAQGYYDTDKTKSVILTSAVKCVDEASYDMVKSVKEGTFPGGKTLTFNAKNNGVGIPATNPNLKEDVISKVKEVFASLQSGKITVADKGDGLIR
jgi:hypothetical protein